MAAMTVSNERDEIHLATMMIELGARLQIVESETHLSRERLSRLYREIRGVVAPKGMLPFSVDWFMTWMPNIHASLFYNIYSFMVEHTELRGVRAVIAAYRLYLDQAASHNADRDEPIMSFTRAWMLVRFFDNKMLQMSECTKCTGRYVAHAHDLTHSFVCAICRPPPRAGKTRAAKARAAARKPAAAIAL
jgi:flagellar transcriptional activator FlhC